MTFSPGTLAGRQAGSLIYAACSRRKETWEGSPAASPAEERAPLAARQLLFSLTKTFLFLIPAAGLVGHGGDVGRLLPRSLYI